MTTIEFEKKIAESNDPDAFNSLQWDLNLPHLNFQINIKGLNAIYKYTNQQVDGWKQYGDTIPPDLIVSKTFFGNLNDQLNRIVIDYNNRTKNEIINQWGQIVNQLYSTLNNSGTSIFLYNAPETSFLIKINEEFPRAYQGAYRFITGRLDQQLNNKDLLIGILLAYEFTLKDNSEIVKRRNFERPSMSKIRSDFQNYLSISEIQLSDHLKNADLNYQANLVHLENLKIEKEKAFDDWFEKSKLEYDQFSNESSKKTKDLEDAYEELLRLKKPADYWKLGASELKTQGRKWFYALLGFIGVASFLLYALLWLTPEGMLKTFFNEDKSLAIRWSIIFITFISFMFFGVRLLTKLTLSSFHLARDAEERERLTYVYLAMIKDASIEKEDRNLVMQSLFSRADTGLFKEESSPTMPGAGSIIERMVRRPN